MQIDQPVPELPVRDLIAAQEWYRDCLGFETGWRHDEGRIGAVSLGRAALFLRETQAAIAPITLWIFAANVDAAHAEASAGGAEITDPIADRPWGLRQFTLRDPNGHILHFHHDL